MTVGSILTATARIVASAIATGLSAIGALSGNKPHPGPGFGPDRREDYRP
ncbi:hypothetical protein ACPEEZ_14720 [Frigoribacterium sp. 2-23]